MKYPVSIYAQALAEIATRKHSPTEEKKVIANFLELLRKNNDGHALSKIAAKAEERFQALTGKKSILIESARNISPNVRTALRAITKDADSVQEKIAPELVAGIRLTINDLQFDGSLARKISKLFNH